MTKYKYTPIERMNDLRFKNIIDVLQHEYQGASDGMGSIESIEERLENLAGLFFDLVEFLIERTSIEEDSLAKFYGYVRIEVENES